MASARPRRPPQVRLVYPEGRQSYAVEIHHTPLGLYIKRRDASHGCLLRWAELTAALKRRDLANALADLDAASFTITAALRGVRGLCPPSFTTATVRLDDGRPPSGGRQQGGRVAGGRGLRGEVAARNATARNTKARKRDRRSAC